VSGGIIDSNLQRPTEVHIRRSIFASTRNLLLLLALFSFIVLSCLAAIWRLVEYRDTPAISLVASALWLLLTAYALTKTYKSGTRDAFLGLLSYISLDHYVVIKPSETLPMHVAIGFRLMGWNLDRDVLILGGIRKVSWGAGQASGMTGRDQNDWYVLIWAQRESVCTTRPNRTPNRPMGFFSGLSGLVAGLSGPRRRVEPFVRELLDMFRQAGLEFDASESGKEFKVRLTTGQP
jgi:hypothetical protein